MTEPLHIPGLNEPIHFRRLNPVELHRVMMKHAGDHAGFRESLIIASACDAEGRPVFTDADAADLGNLPGRLIDLLARVSADLNGILPSSRD